MLRRRRVGLALQQNCRRNPGGPENPALDRIIAGHFVDDFNGVDADEVAESAFQGVAGFLELMGLQTKPSKAQPPAPSQVVQGVLVTVGSEGVSLQPTPKRLEKIMASIQAALDDDDDDDLPPHTANRLAGRLNFVMQSTFGALEKAAQGPRCGRGVRDDAVRRPAGGPALTSRPQAQSGPLHRRRVAGGSHLRRRLLPAGGNTPQGGPLPGGGQH